MSNVYIALIGDIIKSKNLENRTDIQKRLTKTLKELNEEYADVFASNLTVTLGDEFQGVFKNGKAVLEIVDKIKFLMSPVEFRFGIGIGEIITEMKKEISIGADGPAYWNARQAIKDIHSTNDYELSRILVSNGLEEQPLKMINDSLALCDFIESRWRETQRDLLTKSIENYGHSQKVPQIELAKLLGLSSQATNQRIQSSGYYQYLRMKTTIAQELEVLREGIK